LWLAGAWRKKPEHAGTLLMIFSYIPINKEYSHGNTTDKHEYHQAGADTPVAKGIDPFNCFSAPYQQEHSQPLQVDS
ncbi:hypothetical protein, partial [Duncaniella muris]|uniref:hypothetical protein n=1 Tax=Duncaniella muris TaxID=2094150 RepID=UPI0025B6C894